MLVFFKTKLARSANLYHKMIGALKFLCNYYRKMIIYIKLVRTLLLCKFQINTVFKIYNIFYEVKNKR